MKYVDWVDRVWQTAAEYADSDDDRAALGFNTLALPKELGFGDVAGQPGFTDRGGLWEAVQDALADLRDLMLVVNDDSVWRVLIRQDALKDKHLSLATVWQTLFERAEALRPEELDFLARLARPGVGVAEDEQWACRLEVMAPEVFATVGLDWDKSKQQRVLGNLKDQDWIGGTAFIGGNWRLHATYMGIVVATEQVRFEKKPVPEGSPAAFISYAHEDAALARRIATGLQSADLDVEIDEHALAGGDSLVDWVADTTKRVAYVIALVSQHSNESTWCKYEVALAMSDETYLPGVKVIPVKVDKADMPNALRHKVYRSVPKLGVNGVVEELVRDIQKHEERRVKAAAKVS